MQSAGLLPACACAAGEYVKKRGLFMLKFFLGILKTLFGLAVGAAAGYYLAYYVVENIILPNLYII